MYKCRLLTARKIFMFYVSSFDAIFLALVCLFICFVKLFCLITAYIILLNGD